MAATQMELSIAAQKLGITAGEAFNRYVCKGRLRAEKVGKRWFVDAADVQKLRDQLAVPANA